MLFAGISGSSTADAAGIGSLLIPQMKKQGYGVPFSVAITACAPASSKSVKNSAASLTGRLHTSGSDRLGCSANRLAVVVMQKRCQKNF